MYGSCEASCVISCDPQTSRGRSFILLLFCAASLRQEKSAGRSCCGSSATRCDALSSSSLLPLCCCFAVYVVTRWLEHCQYHGLQPAHRNPLGCVRGSITTSSCSDNVITRQGHAHVMRLLSMAPPQYLKKCRAGRCWVASLLSTVHLCGFIHSTAQISKGILACCLH